MPVKCQLLFQDSVCFLWAGWWAGSLSCELDYKKLEDGSFYISAPQQPSFRQPAGIYTTPTHIHTLIPQTDKHTSYCIPVNTHAETEIQKLSYTADTHILVPQTPAGVLMRW